MGSLSTADRQGRPEHSVRCLEDHRVRGCGRWYETPFELRGALIVVTLVCPDCFAEKLDAGDERITEIYREALEEAAAEEPPAAEPPPRRRHSGRTS